MAIRAPWAAASALSLADIAVAAVFFLVLLPRPAIPLIDGDVWWHIRAGEEVLRHGAVPSVDTWTLVSAGRPWVSQDWLSNVILALGYRLGELGPSVLSLLFSLFVVGSAMMLWKGIGLRRASTSWFARILALVAGVTVAGPVVGVRVQVVDLVLAVSTVLVLWAFVARRRALTLAWLPAIALAWANLHAGWVLLFLLGGAVVAGETIDRLARRHVDAPPLRWHELGWLVLSLVASAAAIAINPNGLALYAYPLETSAIAAHRDFLAEWSPPDVGTLPGQLFLGFTLLAVVPALVIGSRWMRTADLLMLGGLTVMAAMAARFLLFLGPIGAAIVVLGLGPVVARSRAAHGFAATLRRMEGRPRSAAAGWVNLGLVGVVVVAGLVVTLARVSPAAQAQAIDDHMPVAAVDWLVANDPGARPFNTYSWGGYLALHRPDRPVFIDGRSDIHGDPPIRAYADAISLRSDPQVLLDAYEIDHVLFNTDHGFADWLDRSELWTRLYTDPMASVWVREGAADD